MKDFKKIHNKDIKKVIKEMKESDLVKVIDYLVSEISDIDKRIEAIESQLNNLNKYVHNAKGLYLGDSRESTGL